jgi:hypothetical protein
LATAARDPKREPVTDDVLGFCDQRTVTVTSREPGYVRVRTEHRVGSGLVFARRRYTLDAFRRLARGSTVIRKA